MTSRIREEAADEAQIRQPIIQWRASTKLECEINCYLFHDFYMLPLLPKLKRRLKFDQFWPSHIQAYPLSTRISWK